MAHRIVTIISKSCHLVGLPLISACEVYIILLFACLCTLFLSIHEPLVLKLCRGCCFPYLLLYHLVIQKEG